MEREVLAIKKMYKNSETFVKTYGEQSKEFEVKVRVHQDSVLNPVLFAGIMNKVTKDVRESGVKKLFHADDLVLLTESWEDTEMRWKKAKKVNVKKTKAFCSGEITVSKL